VSALIAGCLAVSESRWGYARRSYPDPSDGGSAGGITPPVVDGRRPGGGRAKARWWTGEGIVTGSCHGSGAPIVVVGMDRAVPIRSRRRAASRRAALPSRRPMPARRPVPLRGAMSVVRPSPFRSSLGFPFGTVPVPCATDRPPLVLLSVSGALLAAPAPPHHGGTTTTRRSNRHNDLRGDRNRRVGSSLPRAAQPSVHGQRGHDRLAGERAHVLRRPFRGLLHDPCRFTGSVGAGDGEAEPPVRGLQHHHPGAVLGDLPDGRVRRRARP